MSLLIQQETFRVVGMMSFLSVLKDEFKTMSMQLEYLKTQQDTPDKNIKNIIKFTNTGFDINMNNMIHERRYLINFEDSKYIICKNSSDELTVREID